MTYAIFLQRYARASAKSSLSSSYQKKSSREEQHARERQPIGLEEQPWREEGSKPFVSEYHSLGEP
ncbi:MAG: hypothetical protein IPJ85_10320 [Flavobacteriales bacterium]|nr:hypothetical protein [Flavobacteriales bacterium]